MKSRAVLNNSCTDQKSERLVSSCALNLENSRKMIGHLRQSRIPKKKKEGDVCKKAHSKNRNEAEGRKERVQEILTSSRAGESEYTPVYVVAIGR